MELEVVGCDSGSDFLWSSKWMCLDLSQDCLETSSSPRTGFVFRVYHAFVGLNVSAQHNLLLLEEKYYHNRVTWPKLIIPQDLDRKLLTKA